MAGMKKAPKMTKADALYLKKFMAAREAAEIADEEDSLKAELARREEARKYYPEPFDDGKVNVQINARLYLERNKNAKK